MSVPARRKTSRRSRQGRSHHALKKINLNKCPKCGKAIQAHRACSFCGVYKGKEAIKVNTKKTKKEKK
jgi:large subunit ribosomal protein L32